MAKVSIIMPVYNGSKFIRDSIGSILDQTFTDIEMIAVNDGSKDDSLAVLHSIKDGNNTPIQMVIIDQENGGICSSRNAGLAAASGEYIMFIDQDDFYDKDAVAVLLERIEKDNTDIAIAGFKYVDPSRKELNRMVLDARYAWSKFRITTPWARIYRKSVIDRYNISFMITKISEDLYFNYVFLSYTDKISILERTVYEWVCYPESESHSKWNKLDESRNPLVMLTALYNDMSKDNKLEPELIEYANAKHLIWYLLYVAKGADKNDLRRVCGECLAWLSVHYPEYNKHLLKKAFLPKGESGKIRFIVRFSIFLIRIRLFRPFLGLYAKL